jgi:hypothetical protein
MGGMLSHKGPSFKQAHSHAKKADTYLLTLDYYGEHSLHDYTPNSVPITGGKPLFFKYFTVN